MSIEDILNDAGEEPEVYCERYGCRAFDSAEEAKTVHIIGRVLAEARNKASGMEHEIGSRVACPSGRGEVIARSPLEGAYWVMLDDSKKAVKCQEGSLRRLKVPTYNDVLNEIAKEIEHAAGSLEYVYESAVPTAERLLGTAMAYFDGSEVEFDYED